MSGHDDVEEYVPHLTERERGFLEGLTAALVTAARSADYHPATTQGKIVSDLITLHRHAELGAPLIPEPEEVLDAAHRIIHRRAKSSRTCRDMADRLDRARRIFNELADKAHRDIEQRRYRALADAGAEILDWKRRARG